MTCRTCGEPMTGAAQKRYCSWACTKASRPRCEVTEDGQPCGNARLYSDACPMHHKRMAGHGSYAARPNPAEQRWADHTHRSLLRCSEDGCSDTVESRDLCSAHYQTFMRHGDAQADARWATLEACDDCGDPDQVYLPGADRTHPELCGACNRRKIARDRDHDAYWADPEAGRAKGRRRMQAKRDKLLAQVIDRDGPNCYLCPLIDQDPAPGSEVEHKLPLSRGGTWDLPNLGAACRSCNGSKNDRTVAEWLAWKAAA